VGAGGNAGAVIWSTTYNAIGNSGSADVEQDRLGLMVIGFIVLGSSLLVLLCNIHGAAIFWGKDQSAQDKVHPVEEKPPGFKQDTQIQQQEEA
jgi:hypothetical protein